MSDAAMLAPVFVHVVLVIGLVIATGRGRVAAVRAGEVRLKDIALDSSRWPERLRKLANNYQNQFELPVLFYAVMALLIATGLADGVTLVLAWAFVASRLVHSFIHVRRTMWCTGSSPSAPASRRWPPCGCGSPCGSM
jgi:hypothetical protein